MKLAVFGQRSIEDNEFVIDRMLKLLDKNGWGDGNTPLTYLYGGAKGPQRFVLGIMEGHHDTVLFQPWSMVTDKVGEFRVDMFDWRNKQIIDNADEIVIFDNGTPDREADYVLHYVRRHNINYHVFRCD